MSKRSRPDVEHPRVEPEIIPPSADWQRVSRIWVSAGRHHTTRMWITPPGPVGFVFFLLLTLILAFAGVALLVGAALVGIAATGVLLVGGIVSSVLRGQFRRK